MQVEETRSDPRTVEACLPPALRKATLTTAEAEALLHVVGTPRAAATLRKLRCMTDDGPPYFKDGATVRYPRDELIAWAIERRGALRRSTREAPSHG